MGKAMKASDLRVLQACGVVLGMITTAAKVGVATPSYVDLLAGLKAQGLAMSQGTIGKVLDRLEGEGDIVRLGNHARRVYVLPDGSRTVPVVPPSIGKSGVGPDRMAAACAAALATITRAAQDHGPTPSYLVIESDMRAQGVAATSVLVGKVLDQLEADGAIRRAGSRSARVYVLPDGSETRAALPGESMGLPVTFTEYNQRRWNWPRPTPDSAASYDAAVAAMAFRDDTPPRQSWTHTPVRPAAEGRSLTGCAAAMVVGTL